MAWWSGCCFVYVRNKKFPTLFPPNMHVTHRGLDVDSPPAFTGVQV